MAEPLIGLSVSFCLRNALNMPLPTQQDAWLTARRWTSHHSSPVSSHTYFGNVLHWENTPPRDSGHGKGGGASCFLPTWWGLLRACCICFVLQILELGRRSTMSYFKRTLRCQGHTDVLFIVEFRNLYDPGWQGKFPGWEMDVGKDDTLPNIWIASSFFFFF